MEDKALEFVSEFNANEEQTFWELVNNGYITAVSLDNIYLFCEGSDPIDYVEEITLSNMVKKLQPLLNKASSMLNKKIGQHVEDFEKEIQRKFEGVKVYGNRDGLNVTFNVHYTPNYDIDVIEAYMYNLLEDVSYFFGDNVKFNIGRTFETENAGT